MLKKVLENVYVCPPITRVEHLGPLQEVGITHVANLAGVLNHHVLEAGNLTYHVSNWIDSGKDQTPHVWRSLHRFFEEFLATPGAKLAVHCIGGPRRSASALYMLLRMKGLTDDEAVAFLKVALPGDRPIYSGPISEWMAREKKG